MNPQTAHKEAAATAIMLAKAKAAQRPNEERVAYQLAALHALRGGARLSGAGLSMAGQTRVQQLLKQRQQFYAANEQGTSPAPAMARMPLQAPTETEQERAAADQLQPLVQEVSDAVRVGAVDSTTSSTMQRIMQLLLGSVGASLSLGAIQALEQDMQETAAEAVRIASDPLELSAEAVRTLANVQLLAQRNEAVLQMLAQTVEMQPQQRRLAVAALKDKVKQIQHTAGREFAQRLQDEYADKALATNSIAGLRQDVQQALAGMRAQPGGAAAAADGADVVDEEPEPEAAAAPEAPAEAEAAAMAAPVPHFNAAQLQAMYNRYDEEVAPHEAAQEAADVAQIVLAAQRGGQEERDLVQQAVQQRNAELLMRVLRGVAGYIPNPLNWLHAIARRVGYRARGAAPVVIAGLAARAQDLPAEQLQELAAQIVAAPMQEQLMAALEEAPAAAAAQAGAQQQLQQYAAEEQEFTMPTSRMQMAEMYPTPAALRAFVQWLNNTEALWYHPRADTDYETVLRTAADRLHLPRGVAAAELAAPPAAEEAQPVAAVAPAAAAVAFAMPRTRGELEDLYPDGEALRAFITWLNGEGIVTYNPQPQTQYSTVAKTLGDKLNLAKGGAGGEAAVAAAAAAPAAAEAAPKTPAKVAAAPPAAPPSTQSKWVPRSLDEARKMYKDVDSLKAFVARYNGADSQKATWQHYKPTSNNYETVLKGVVQRMGFK